MGQKIKKIITKLLDIGTALTWYIFVNQIELILSEIAIDIEIKTIFIR